ncbi:aromatic acid exporter family protein [Bacillus luti]|nr:lipoprotein [Bacillus cereus]
MQIGARILKTTLSVIISLWAATMIGFSSPIFAGITGFLTIKPTVFQAWRDAWLQTIANFFGAALALIFVLFIGTTPLHVGVAVLILLLFHSRFSQMDLLGISIITLMSIMEYQHGNIFTFALERFSTTMVGVLVACLVNITIFPPKYESRLIKQINNAFRQSEFLLSDISSHHLTIESKKSYLQHFENTIHTSEQMLHHFKEEFLPFKFPIYPYQKTGYHNQKKLIVFQTWTQLMHIKHKTYSIFNHHHSTFDHWSNEEKEAIQSFISKLLDTENWLLLQYEKKLTTLPSLPNPESLPHHLLENPSTSILFGILWEWNEKITDLYKYTQKSLRNYQKS